MKIAPHSVLLFLSVSVLLFALVHAAPAGAVSSKAIYKSIETEKDITKLRSLATAQAQSAEQAQQDAKRSAEEAQRLKDDVARLNAEATRLKAEKQTLEQQTQQLRAAADRLRADGAAVAEQITKLQQETQQLATEKTRLLGAIQEAKVESDRAAKANADLITKLKTDVEALQKEKGNVSTDVTQLRKDVASLDEQKKKKEQELAEAESRLKVFTTGVLGLVLTNGLAVYSVFSGRRKARLEEEQLKLTIEELRQKQASKPA